MVDSKGTSRKGRVDKELCHRRRGSNLCLDTLLDDIPNLWDSRHDGRSILLEGSNGVGTSSCQSLWIGIANGASQ
jgi:hypothetical protein